MYRTNVDPLIIEKVKKYLYEVERNHVKVKEAYIFGSQSQGTAYPSSDIDVCVISDDFKHHFDDGVFLTKIAARSDDTMYIEPHPMTPEDFANEYLQLAYTIRETGQLVNIH